MLEIRKKDDREMNIREMMIFTVIFYLGFFLIMQILTQR